MSKKTFKIPIFSNILASKWMVWLDARSLRERFILFIATIILIYVAWNSLFFKPIKTSIRKRQNQIVDITEKLQKIDAEITETVETLENISDDGSGDLAERAKLIEQAKLLDEKLGLLTSDLVSSNQMVTALRTILERQQRLHLISLDTAPAEVLDTSDDLADSIPGVYKHEITIVLLGDYFSVLNYLQSLEALGWRLFWDSMDYKVIAYPTAQITIKLHTLSTQKGFISG